MEIANDFLVLDITELLQQSPYFEPAQSIPFSTPDLQHKVNVTVFQENLPLVVSGFHKHPKWNGKLYNMEGTKTALRAYVTKGERKHSV